MRMRASEQRSIAAQLAGSRVTPQQFGFQLNKKGFILKSSFPLQITMPSTLPRAKALTRAEKNAAEQEKRLAKAKANSLRDDAYHCLHHSVIQLA